MKGSESFGMFWRSSILCSIMVVVYSQNRVHRLPFLRGKHSHYIVALIGISLTTSDDDHLFMCLVIIFYVWLKKFFYPLFKKTGIVLLLNLMSPYIFPILIFYHLWFINKLTVELYSLNFRSLLYIYIF